MPWRLHGDVDEGGRMAGTARDTRDPRDNGRRAARADEIDWDVVQADLDANGGALIGPLLAPDEAAWLAGLYDEGTLFRATVDMGRHRFGEGEYRYFAAPLPQPVAALRQVLYPRLLPFAREWWTRLGRPTPWPETLDEWLEQCHEAGQTKPTPLLLRYEAGGWNALHRDLYGDLVFPLQAVVNLSDPGVD